MMDNIAKNSVRNSLRDIGPLPEEAVFLGVAHDGPVLMNVKDRRAPNILVWDRTPKQGLQILKVVSEYLLGRKSKTPIEFMVLTRFPEDWGQLNEYGMGIGGHTSCIGILPFYSDIADQAIASLSAWFHRRESSWKPFIVLIDGLENMQRVDDSTKMNLKYILMHGRSRNVYVIGTSKMKYKDEILFWSDSFQHEIFGSDVEDVFETLEGDDKRTLIFSTPISEIR